MNIGITQIIENIGVSFESTIMLIAVIGGLIFFARGFKLGLIIQLVIHTMLFMWFYTAGYDWIAPITVVLITIVLLTFSLISNNRTKGISNDIEA
jgi:uncharacterized protein YacL